MKKSNRAASALAAFAVVSVAIAPAVLAAQDAGGAATSEAEALAWAEADRMVTAVGGKENWARANFYRILAHHHPPLRVGGSHLNIIEMDMNQPRMRFEARGPGLNSLRMVDGEVGWRIVDGAPVAMTAEAVASDVQWWQQHVYRMFHRIALREPGLQPRIGRDGRLELWSNGQFVNWYKLGVDGTPYAFGMTESAERWSLFGPFVQAQPGGVRYPKWTAWSDGTFRTDSGLFEVYETLPQGFSFSPAGAPGAP